MKTYVTPEMTVLPLESADVLTASGGYSEDLNQAYGADQDWGFVQRSQ